VSNVTLHPHGSNHRHDLAGELAVLRAVLQKHGFVGELSLADIADCVGVRKQSIHQIERQAMGKVRARLQAALNYEEVRA
jgi:DNA-directed RNA polymerase sigma subunit (sigma70/sigma32)